MLDEVQTSRGKIMVGVSIRFGAIGNRKGSSMNAAFVDGEYDACRPKMWQRPASLLGGPFQGRR